MGNVNDRVSKESTADVTGGHGLGKRRQRQIIDTVFPRTHSYKHLVSSPEKTNIHMDITTRWTQF